MGRLMDDALGIGLAATQLGVMHRVLVYRVEPDAPLGVLVNPQIEWSGDELETMEEGCLSLPGRRRRGRAARARARARQRRARRAARRSRRPGSRRA